MRKVLSFVLVLAMILGSVSMVFATDFSDTKGESYAAAAGLLSDLGVINGYADGTFGGSKNITRAEYVAMMVRALGYDVTGTAATGFKDVANDYWASAAINYAKTLGITKGYADGTFRPTANVTLDEAIAFTVRALGYQDEYLTGSYPANCINQALQLGMLDGVKTGSVAATRGEVATLVYNALDNTVITGYNKDGSPIYGQVTLLGRLGVYPETASGKAVYTVVKGTESSSISLAPYVGQYVQFYKSSKTNKVVGIYDVKSTSLTGKFDGTKFIVDETSYIVDPVTDGYYDKNDDAAEYFYNGRPEDDAPYADGTFTIAAKVDGLTITDIYSISKWVGVDYKIDAEELAEELALKAPTFCDQTLKLDTSKKIDTTKFDLVGATSLAAIPDDAIVTVYVNDYVTKVEVSTKTVAGTIDKHSYTAKTDEIKWFIDGTGYKAALIDGSDALAVKGEGTAYLNYAGKIAFWDETETEATYAVLLASENATAGKDVTGSTAYVKLLLADGTEAKYEVPKKAKINGVELTTTSALKTALGVEKDIVVTYTLNSAGNIKSLSAVDFNGSYPDTKVAEDNTIGGNKLNDKTVVFTYTVDDGDYTWAVGTSSLKGVQAETFKVYQSKNIVKVVEMYQAKSTAIYAMFNGYAKVNNTKYDYSVDVLENGEAKTYFIDELFDGDELIPSAFRLNVIEKDAAGNLASIKCAESEFTTVTAITDRATTGAITVSADKTVVKVDGTNYRTIATDAIVYKWNEDDEVWEKSTISAVKNDDVAGVVFYDTNDTPDNVFNIVVIYTKGLAD